MKQFSSLLFGLCFLMPGSLLAQDTLFYENFSSGEMPGEITLRNLDGLTPEDPNLSALADSAWTVQFITAQGFPSGYSGFSVSWYQNDAGPSDDWMILPGIELGASTVLSWTAMAITSTGDFRDVYQVFVATDTSIAAFTLHAPIFETGSLGEVDTPQFRSVNINAAASHVSAGDTVYLAFRNYTPGYDDSQPVGPGNGGNELAIDSIVVSADTSALSIASLSPTPTVRILNHPLQDRHLQAELTLSQSETMTFEVLDLQGRSVLSLPAQQLEVGTHRFTLDLAGVGPGTYLLQARGSHSQSSTRVLLK
jgi:hypothetical protein